MRRLHQESSTRAPAGFHYDVAAAINAASQEMFKSPLGEAWSRLARSFTTVPGVSDYTLDPTISNVLGDVRCDSKTVAECQFEGTFFELADRYGIRPGSRPQYYLLGRINGGESAADATVLQMSLWPTPARPHSMTFDALVEPRRFTACDLETEVVLPVPDQQVESIFLPIALFHLASSEKLIDERVRSSIEAGRQNARALLGYSEPSAAKRSTFAASPA